MKKLETKPLRSTLFSLKYATPVVYSPPTENACIRRKRSNNIKDTDPAYKYDGKQAIPKVAIAIKLVDIKKVLFLPNLSDIEPSTIPPSGRAKYATEKIKNINNRPFFAVSLGKNTEER